MRLVKYIVFAGMCGASTVTSSVAHKPSQPWLHPAAVQTAWQRFFLTKMVTTAYDKACCYGRWWWGRKALCAMSFDKKLDRLDQEIETLRQRGVQHGMNYNQSPYMIDAIFDAPPEQLVKDLERLPQGCDPASSCVVSLTSYPARMHAGVTLAALVSLVRSQVKPHAIVLYLSKDQFPGGQIGGPYGRAYRVLQDKGVTVRYVDDVRCHTKYFYVCDDYPHHAHVTVDDDHYYPRFLLAELHKGAEKNPGARIGGRVLQLVPDLLSPATQEMLKSKTSTRFLCSGHVNTPSFRWLATGCGGVWYPKGVLCRMRDLIVKNNLYRHYPSNDDECLHAASVVCGVPVMNVPSCMPHGFSLLAVSRGDVGGHNGLWSGCNGVLTGQKDVLKGDILYHKIFSHRFPEFDNKNAYDVMNMEPNPDVVKVMVSQNQSAHTDTGARKGGCGQ